MTYRTVGMLKDGGFQKDLNDHQSGSGTTYMLSRDRAPFRVDVAGGLLVRRGEAGSQLFDTTSSANEAFIFVMAADGQIYSADKAAVQHHSSFLAGREVAAAGSWTVRHGRLTMITNQSGHYQTPVDYAGQVLKELKSRGVNLDNVIKNWIGGTASQTASALKTVGHTRQRIGERGFEDAKF